MLWVQFEGRCYCSSSEKSIFNIREVELCDHHVKGQTDFKRSQWSDQTSTTKFIIVFKDLFNSECKEKSSSDIKPIDKLSVSIPLILTVQQISLHCVE